MYHVSFMWYVFTVEFWCSIKLWRPIESIKQTEQTNRQRNELVSLASKQYIPGSRNVRNAHEMRECHIGEQ